MKAFEIGHFRSVAGLGQGLEAGHDEVGQAAAQHRLLAEQVCLAFLLEGRLDHAGAAAADRRGVGERDVVGVAAGVLRDRDQAGHAAAALIFGADGVAGALGRDHEDVDVGTRLDEAEMDVEAVGEGEGGALLHVRREVLIVDTCLIFVGREDHDDVRPGRGVGVGQHPKAGFLGLGGGGGAGAERDRNLAHARVAQVLGVGVALAAIADDRDLLALDEPDVGIPVVVNAHLQIPMLRCQPRGSGDPVGVAAGFPLSRERRVAKAVRPLPFPARWRRRRCGRPRPGRPGASAPGTCRSSRGRR